MRHLSHCFYIAVNRICVAISRVDGALKPWSAIHLGVGNSKQKTAYLDCLFQLCIVCFGSRSGRNHYYDSTAQMAMQQHVVEHGEHDKAQQKSWSSTASGLSSRCPDTVLPLDPPWSGWESEVDCALLPHYNPIHSACNLNQQHTFTATTNANHTKPCGNGLASKLKLRTYTQAAWFYMVAFLKSKAVWEFGSRTERLSRPF